MICEIDFCQFNIICRIDKDYKNYLSIKEEKNEA